LISWYFDIEYLREKLKSGEHIKDLLAWNEKSVRLHALSRLFLLSPGRYSLKIMGHEVLSDDSKEPLIFLFVPQDSFLVSIYLRGALEHFNNEILTSEHFIGFLRRWVYPSELRKMPDPKLKEVPIEEIRREYLVECPDIKGFVFDVLFGRHSKPVIFKRIEKRALVCSELYFAEEDGTLNPRRVIIECDAHSLSKAFFEMGVETLNLLKELAQLLPRSSYKEALSAYIGVLEKFKNFIRGL